MKKNIAIIILSVLLAVTAACAAVLGVSLLHPQEDPFETARLAEQVWDDYMSTCAMIGCNPQYDFSNEDTSPHVSEVIRCVYVESFDESIPTDQPLAENERYSPTGSYVYDICIYNDGSGYLHYQQWGSIHTVEVGYWEFEGETREMTELIGWRNVLFTESTVELTAEEVGSIFAVMEQHDYENVPTTNPYMYTGMDGDTTFVVYSSSTRLADHVDWRGHMISTWCAKEGSPCYEIRKAIEKLVIAHNAGPIPVKEIPY
jgi:hypothetical protein